MAGRVLTGGAATRRAPTPTARLLGARPATVPALLAPAVVPLLRRAAPRTRADEYRSRPWLLLAPEGAVSVPAAHLRRPDDVPPAPISLVVCSSHPGGRRRLRRRARRAGLVVTRELIVLPTLRHPIVVLDDNAASVGDFWASIAAVPPGLARSATVAGACLRLARRAPWRWTGALAPGHVLIGRAP